MKQIMWIDVVLHERHCQIDFCAAFVNVLMLYLFCIIQLYTPIEYHTPLSVHNLTAACDQSGSLTCGWFMNVCFYKLLCY